MVERPRKILRPTFLRQPLDGDRAFLLLEWKPGARWQQHAAAALASSARIGDHIAGRQQAFAFVLAPARFGVLRCQRAQARGIAGDGRPRHEALRSTAGFVAQREGLALARAIARSGADFGLQLAPRSSSSRGCGCGCGDRWYGCGWLGAGGRAGSRRKR